ncbi:hypothetical protein E2C01_005353 [Portunus trituberculatus]|uniref:Uncharacterized protein n=1 Tax=Portunus trituberculatus TaxID=210409 RepID=A0A5B7CT50_PORTR|nr:hypothetical protein [Portunus trituberculatus]
MKTCHGTEGVELLRGRRRALGLGNTYFELGVIKPFATGTHFYHEFWA